MKMEKEIGLNQRGQFSRYIFYGLAWLFVACIVIQTGLAGLATFTDPTQWSKHTTFVHLFEMVPLLMLLFSFVGRLSKALRWQSAGLFALIFLQYLTANLSGAGVLHPIIALFLFWLSLHVARKGRRALK